MSSLLILLGLFSITLIISNLGILKKAQGFSYVSIPLLLGIVFSEDGPLPILPSTKEDLSWALRVGLTWVSFLAGTRLSELSFSWKGVGRLTPVFVNYLIFFGAGFGILKVFGQAASFEVQIGMSLFLTAALFSSRENPFLLVVLFVSMFSLFGEGERIFGASDLVFPVALGLLMGVVCRLIIPPSQKMDTPLRLTLVGLCVLGTGWSIGMGSLEVLFGLSLGWAMSWVHKYGVCKDPSLKASEAPVRFVLALFAGFHVQISVFVLVVGVSLIAFRLLLKWVMLRFGFREVSDEEMLSQVLPISPLALPIVLSLHLSGFSGDVTAFLLSAFCIGFIVDDFIWLFVELSKKRSVKQGSVS